ncbi:YacL family protein [Pseudocolwellia sp. AS88]
MEYEFIHDSLTGSATARFSMEHEIMGPWLEVEIGKNTTKLLELIKVIDNLKERQTKDVVVNGVEYTLIFSEDSVSIISNANFEQIEHNLENVEIEQGLNTDFDSSAECGIEDFKELLVKWSNFIK